MWSPTSYEHILQYTRKAVSCYQQITNQFFRHLSLIRCWNKWFILSYFQVTWYGETLSIWQVVSMSALHSQGGVFNPHCVWECYNGVVSETILGCWVWRDTCPSPVGWHGAVRMVHDFFIWMTLGRSLHLMGRAVISPSDLIWWTTTQMAGGLDF